VPVKSAEPGKVDVLVVTRDIWSLRLNTQYTFQEGRPHRPRAVAVGE